MILAFYVYLSMWLRDVLTRSWRIAVQEERGASSVEGIALIAVVLITLTVVMVYIGGPGRVRVIDALNNSLARQLGQWR